MLMIGLTGGIGAGKSAVAARLAEHGAVIVDGDTLAREAVAPGTEGLREVVAAFGAGVLHPDGSLNRPAVGARVFGDEAARRTLEGIVHPRVRARTAELVAAAPPDAIVVNDVPLLVEAGLAPSYQLVVVVQAAERVRVDRLVRARGMTEADALARVRAQASDEQRRAVADVVLPNEGSLADLHGLVDALWEGRLRPYEENLRLGRPASGARAADDSTYDARFSRIAARLRHAAGDLVAGVACVSNTADGALEIELTLARPVDASVLAAAGFVPAPGGGYGSADPGDPATVRLRVSPSTPAGGAAPVSA